MFGILLQVLLPAIRSSQSTIPQGNFAAVFEPGSNMSRQEDGYRGARAKTIKNKENRNKSFADKKSNLVNGNSEEHVASQLPPKQLKPNWQPRLRLKRYDDDDADTTNRKVVQKKQLLNKTVVKNETAPLTPAHPSEFDSLLTYRSIPLPAGLDPVANPHNIDRIYIKRSNCDDIGEVDLETDYISVHHLNKDNCTVPTSSQTILETPNICQIRNDLWDGQTKDNNKGNGNVAHIRLDPSRNNTIQVIDNDLDINSLQQERSMTVLKLTNPLSVSGASTSIVVPYQDSMLTENSLQISGTPIASPFNTVPFNTSPTPAFTNTNPNLLSFGESLPSGLSSSVLFGDGLTVGSDYVFAQKLQQKFDREHQAMQCQMQHSIPLDDGQELPPVEEHFDDHVSLVPPQGAQDELNSLDYNTANEFPILIDSLTNDIEPVYDPREEDELFVQTPQEIYIPLDSLAETENNWDECVGSATADVVIPHIVESGKAYPETQSPSEHILVRYEDGNGKFIFIQRVRMHCMYYHYYPQ